MDIITVQAGLHNAGYFSTFAAHNLFYVFIWLAKMVPVTWCVPCSELMTRCNSVGVFKVDLMYNIENNMPKFIQREVHVKRAVVKPNEGTSSFVQKVCLITNSLWFSAMY